MIYTKKLFVLNYKGDCIINKQTQGGKDEGPRVNDQIKAETVRLIDADGEMIGVTPLQDALKAAEDAELDLVEVSPNANPPVCKILNHGKYKYEQQKKAAEARKKQKTIDVKEIKLRPGIEEHDFDVKMRNARRFLEDGNKVKVTMRFRGRELAHQEIGVKVVERLKEAVSDISKVDFGPRLEGRQMIMVLSAEK